VTKLRDLIERRVPQYLGVYLGAAFGIVQFIAFMEERYAISPHWTNLALLLFALLIPSVVLFTYNHGKPGKDEWARSEKLGIPANLVLAVGILFAVFGTKDLGAMTMSVTTKDETGKTVEREVVKSSYRQRLALFNFDAPAGDSALTWLQYGLPNALFIDLLQDMFIDAHVPGHFREKLRELGFRSEVNVPLSLKKQIAEEQHLPHFTDVKLSRSGDQIAVDFAIYETASGKLVERTNVQSNNVFELIDQLTIATKKSLDIPETDKVQDLPVAEVLTSSVPAFRQWVEGVMALQLNDQWPQAAQQLEKAVQSDPTFAHAWLALHNIYLLAGQPQKSLPPLQKAMDHQYRVPERLQYDLKAEYYAVAKQDPEKARAVAEMKTTLFPDDVQAWVLLAQMQNMVNDQKGRIVSFNKILELDPAQHEVLRELGSIYERQGEFDNALKYYSQYSERFPKKTEAALSIGSLQQLQGKHDQARESFNRALLVAPEDVNALIAVAGLERDLGNFDAAERQYQSALAAAKTDEARQRVLDAQSDYYAMRGKMRDAVRLNEEMLTQARKVKPRLFTALDELNSLDRYVRAGQLDVARRMRARAAADLQPPYDGFVAVGDLRIGLATEDTAAIAGGIAGVEAIIRNMGVKALQANVLNARGQLAELRGQCQEAITQHEERLKMTPANYTIHIDIGRCYRKLKQPQKAIEHLQKALTVIPANGRANYEIGLAYLEAGDRSKAAEYVNRAVQTWSEADPAFKPAAEAKAKARELSATS
jgi:tetratricopeptide (TPR) repeat protein